MKKITLISFSVGTVRKAVFIELEYIDEKPVLEMDVLNSILEQEFGYVPARGVTLTIG